MIEVLHPRMANPKVCRRCYSCVESCTVNAIAYEDRFIVNLKRCYSRRACQDAVPICVESCPTGAIKPAVFKALSVNDLPEEVEPV